MADALKLADFHMEQLKKQELDAQSLYALDSTSKDTQRTLLPLTNEHKALNQSIQTTVKPAVTNAEKEPDFFSRSLEMHNGDSSDVYHCDVTEPLPRVDRSRTSSMLQLPIATSHSTHNEESQESLMQDLTSFLDEVSSISV